MTDDSQPLPPSWRTFWRTRRGLLGFCAEVLCWAAVLDAAIRVVTTVGHALG